MKRRNFIASVGAGIATLSGCISLTGQDNPSNPNGNDSGSDKPDNQNGGSCGDLMSFPVNLDEYEIKYGSTDVFRVTAIPDPVKLSDEITFRLENIAQEQKTTGVKGIYTIQKKVDGDWKHIYRVGEHFGWDASAQIHKPGEGYEWKFTVSREGLSNDQRHVCSELSSGTYRFVYFGLGNKKAVAREFDVQDGCNENRDKNYTAGDSVIKVEWVVSSLSSNRGEYVPIEFSELTTEEKSILREAVETGRYKTCDVSPALQRFIQRVKSHIKKQEDAALDIVYLKYKDKYYALLVRKQDMVISGS